MKFSKGLTLIELMVSLAVSSIVALGVMTAYASQSKLIVHQARSTQATEDGRDAFEVISRLLKQSQAGSITITNTGTSSTVVDFTLPPGLAIWPNTTPPYSNNAVRLSWTDTGANASQVLLATAPSVGALGGAASVVLAGSSSVKNTQIAGMTLTAQPDGSYLLKLVAQAGGGAFSTPLKIAFEGKILPRN